MGITDWTGQVYVCHSEVVHGRQNEGDIRLQETNPKQVCLWGLCFRCCFQRVLEIFTLLS